MTIGHKPTMFDNIMFGIIIVLLIILGIGLAQPVWRGEEMAQEFIDNCAKRGGVLLEHKGYLGITYRCASRLD